MSSKRHADTRSSFAQSFFQSNSDGSDDGSHFPVPASRPSTRRPSTNRSVARRNTADSVSTSEVAAAAAVAAESFESGENERSSWYADALLQQGDEENLQEFLKQASDTDKGSTFGDKEVLEQYRIMAQCEARLRVKENIGFDMDECEATHKLSKNEKPDNRALFGSSKKSKHRLPEPKRTSARPTKLPLEGPPLLPPRPDPKLVKQKCKHVPELQAGTMITRGDNLLPGHHTVKCLGCRSSLRVHQLASLVRCPECKVISPASSTRR